MKYKEGKMYKTAKGFNYNNSGWNRSMFKAFKDVQCRKLTEIGYISNISGNADLRFEGLRGNWSYRKEDLVEVKKRSLRL